MIRLHRHQFQCYTAMAVRSSTALFALLMLVFAASAQVPVAKQAGGLDTPPRTWVDAAASNEMRIINSDDGKTPLRYRMRKVDDRGDITREVIESRSGNVARLVQRNGQPITTAEDAAEQQRLKDILASPGDFIRHHRRDDATRNDSIQLVKEMPKAMIFTYAPGQPQLPGVAGHQIVIDFTPDKNYKTPETLDDLLTGIEGRMWIDVQARRVVRIEGHVLQDVKFGWGFLGKISRGGTIVLNQVDATGDRWVYSQLDTHLTLRVLVKTIQMNDKMTATDFRPLPGPISVQDAVKTLLAMPVTLR